MAGNNHKQAAERLNEAEPPTHPQWEKERDMGDYGCAVYYYSQWDVTADEYAGDADDYEHVKDHMHGFTVELSHDGDGMWSARLCSPTPRDSHHEPNKHSSDSNVTLEAAINHIEHLLSSVPQR